MSQTHKPQLLTVQQLLNKDFYLIPAYQRNYAWGDPEISQLIDDVHDYAQRNVEDHANDYYIGTLVVYRHTTDKQPDREVVWEVVDGQQRLTTLSLLVSVLRTLHSEFESSMSHMPLQFECREISSHALNAVFFNEPHSPSKYNKNNPTPGGADDNNGAKSIWNGRSIIERLLRNIPENERKIFASFLLNKVQLLRVELPPRTDLNHYFEVMNNRGEQLAKHEVLKARLLGKLQHDSLASQMLNAVWNACSAMDRSVQSGFTPETRKKLFNPDGKFLLVKDEAALLTCFTSNKESTVVSKSLQDLIEAETQGASDSSEKYKLTDSNEDEEDESKAQFGAIINFPNFLLQVLAMMPSDKFTNTPLDDKNLLTAFEPLLRSDARQIQEFSFRLLRCRFLLDQYIIKSSIDSINHEEHWKLQRCKFRNDKAVLQWINTFDLTENQDHAERLRMLQAAFHVSYMLPTRKHWLQGMLRWLYRQDVEKPIDTQQFLLALEALAKAFVLEAGINTTTYGTIVCRQSFFEPQQPKYSALIEEFPKKLRYGESRLIDFNYLDYLLWLQAKNNKDTHMQEWKNFEFTSTRRSVEHLHPQTELVPEDKWNDDDLHAFGNLCLVSHAMNSRLGNAVPEQKFKQLTSEKHNQSLKVFSMYSSFIGAKKSWAAEGAMHGHSKEMLNLMRHTFESGDLIDLSCLQM